MHARMFGGLASSFVALLLTAQSASAQESKIAVMPAIIESSADGQVPDLFDDYLLTAVQNAGDFEVIGRDDINTLLGFEQQRDILNCDDASCIADLGGALGVDKIVQVKIARLGDDWVATAKLINIKKTKVEHRVNQIVPGDTKALLHSVPALAAKLFGKHVPKSTATPPPVSTPSGPQSPTKATGPTSPTAATGATVATGPDASFGRAPRIVGTIMLLAGAGLAVLGGLIASTSGTDDCYYDYDLGYEECDYGDDELVVLGGLGVVSGLVVSGIGAKQRANGVARRELASDDAAGRPAVYWLGWTLAGVAMATPFLSLAEVIDSDTADTVGWATGMGALATFIIGSFAGVSASQAALEIPAASPSMGYAQTSDGGLTPTFGLGFNF